MADKKETPDKADKKKMFDNASKGFGSDNPKSTGKSYTDDEPATAADSKKVFADRAKVVGSTKWTATISGVGPKIPDFAEVVAELRGAGHSVSYARVADEHGASVVDHSAVPTK